MPLATKFHIWKDNRTANFVLLPEGTGFPVVVHNYNRSDFELIPERNSARYKTKSSGDTLNRTYLKHSNIRQFSPELTIESNPYRIDK